MQSSIFVDPSLAGPDVRFSTGQVGTDGQEQFNPVLPDIEGAADGDWNITQWATPASQIFDPAVVVRGNPTDADPLLGSALASWHTGTGTGGSALGIYGGGSGVTFRLGATGGHNKDTFLQTTGYASGANTFDRQITFNAQERLVAATAGSGTAIAFNAFTVFFNAADNPSWSASLPQTEMFLQVPLTDFRGEPGVFTTLTPGNTYQQIYNLSSWSTAADGSRIADESTNYLQFGADNGALHDVSIDLNQALLRMVRLMAAQNPSMASNYLDLSRWSLGSVYSGVETGGGDGANAASLTMDIAHPVVTRDDAVAVSADAAPATVQSINNGAYAESEDATVINTLAGATDTVRLTNRNGAQVLTGHGRDTVLVGEGIVATLHGLGDALDVIGSATGTGRVAVDGTAPLSVSGSFNAVSVNSDADGAMLSATVLAGATLLLGGVDDVVSISGRADAVLSGAGVRFSAGSGSVTLRADGASINQNGVGDQTVFLNNTDAMVTQTGAGRQVVAGQQTGGGHLALSGGAGEQTVWTGSSAAAIDAAGSGSLSVFVQAGSVTNLVLDGETTALDALDGVLTVTGSAAAGSARLSVGQGSAVVHGGAETLMASLDGGGRMQVFAGSGSQTVFGGPGTLMVVGSHDTAGSQLVVNGIDATASTTIFGGRTTQTIWTGNASDTIVSSTDPGDASGRINAMIQGGTSAYWGGVETAMLDNLGGTLDAFLSGNGAVSVLADMTAHTNTTLAGFDSGRDSLVLRGIPDPSALHVTQSGGGTLFSFNDSRVLLQGILHPALTQNGSDIAVSGRG